MIEFIFSIILVAISVWLIKKDVSFLELLATSILFFLGITGFLPFILREYGGVDYAVSSEFLLSLFAFTLIISSILNRAFLFSNIAKAKERLFAQKFKTQEVGLLIFLLVIVVRGIFIPMRGWDAFSLYDARAKLFLLGLKQADLNVFSRYDDFNQLYYFSYPPMTSVIHAILYSWNFTTPMVAYALFYSVVVIYVYILLSSLKIDKFLKVGLFVVAVLSPQILDHVNLAYTNLPMLAFQFGSLFYLLNFARTYATKDLVFSGILSSFANWTRSLEPIFIGFILALLVVVFRNPRLNATRKIAFSTLYVALVIITRVIWFNYIGNAVGSIGEATPGIFTILLKLSQALYLANIVEVTFFIYTALFSIKYYLLLFLVMAFFVYFKGFNKLSNEGLVVLVILISLGIIMFTGALYFSTSLTWWSEVPGSFLRSNLILIPLSVLFTGFVLERYHRSKKFTQLN